MGVDTRADMRSDLYLLLDSRDEVDPTTAAGQAKLDRFLNYSYMRLQLPTTFEHPEMMTTQAIVLATGVGSVAVTPWAIDHIRYNNYGRHLRPMSRAQLSNTTIPSGEPTRFARWGSTLYYDYIPTSAQNGHTLTIYGWAAPTTISASSAASLLSVVWDEVIVVGAAWRGWRSLGDHVRADVFREEYAALVNDNKSVLQVEGHIPGWRAQYGSSVEYM